MAQPQAQAEGRSGGRGRVLLLLLLLLGHLCVTGTSRSLSCRSQSASLTNPRTDVLCGHHRPLESLGLGLSF